MHISLIGMSNIGKTYGAKSLALHHGYQHIDCDARIEEKLGTELTKDGLQGIQGLARWMGFPSDDRYEERSRRYLDLERETMKEALNLIQNNPEKPIVLDTTGSVIYVGDDILASLRALTRIICFEASERQTESLFHGYINRPKPVVWNGMYTPRPNETPEESMKRCYSELLRDRARRYKEIAHVVIPSEKVSEHWADLGTFVLNALQTT